MLIYFLAWNLLDVPFFCLTSWVSWICGLRFYQFGHLCLHQLRERVLGCYEHGRIAYYRRWWGQFHWQIFSMQMQWPVSWYLISSLAVYRCSCMHIISMLWHIADVVSSCSCPILFKVLTSNVAICNVCLHLSNFGFGLSSVADFSGTEARAPTSAGWVTLSPVRKAMLFGQVVWV